MKALRERLAAAQHEIWSHWMAHLFSVSVRNRDGSYTIPAALVERWQRQMNTTYEQLSENEKESDREQAEKLIAVGGWSEE